MNATDLKRMIIGVVIGILATLFLTLNVWGDEWYKVIPSIAFGVILGMFIADYRLAANIFGAAYKNSIKGRSINVVPYIKKIAPIVLARLFLGFIFVIIPIIFMMISTVLAEKFEDERFLIIYIFQIILIVKGMFSMTYGAWNKLSEKHKLKIWGETELKNRFSNESEISGSLDFDHYRQKYSGQRIARAMIVSTFRAFIAKLFGILHLPRVFKFFGKVIISAVLLIGTIGLTLPFWVIKEITKSSKMLTLFSSIVAGGIVGTTLHSYWYGIGAGLLMLLCSYVLSKIEEVDIIYFTREGRLLDRMWS